jgi:hypothetical protein
MQIAPAFRLRPNAVRSHLKDFGRVAIKVHHDSKPAGDMMKIFLPGLALVALVAAGPVRAADLAPTYKAAPAATSFSWSGFYLGGDIGGVFGGGA